MDGERAFPRPAGSGEFYPQDGMSLRDYFAAAAVQSVSCGIIAEKNYGTSPDWLAVTAYEIADSMLLVRDKKSGGA